MHVRNQQTGPSQRRRNAHLQASPSAHENPHCEKRCPQRGEQPADCNRPADQPVARETACAMNPSGSRPLRQVFSLSQAYLRNASMPLRSEGLGERFLQTCIKRYHRLALGHSDQHTSAKRAHTRHTRAQSAHTHVQPTPQHLPSWQGLSSMLRWSTANQPPRHVSYSASQKGVHTRIAATTPSRGSHGAHSSLSHRSRHSRENASAAVWKSDTRTASVCALHTHKHTHQAVVPKSSAYDTER